MTGIEVWQLIKCHRRWKTARSVSVKSSFMTLLFTLLMLVQTTDNRARLDTLRTQGYEALYNLDYAGARKRFREMLQIAPDHPAGAQCLAASLWVEQLNQSWELKATLY